MVLQKGHTGLISSDSGVERNMARIMAIFQRIQAETANAKSVDVVVELLQREDSEYRSIAYEAAAMELALVDLSDGISLDRWYSLCEASGMQHDVHTHVGLGWALAKLQKSPSKYIENLQPLLKWRVVDGMGYYFGLFNKRRTLSQQEIPALLKEEAHASFDQGAGRSIWYMCKANSKQLEASVENFSSERRPNLWRGIGIACAYVGGCTGEELAAVYQSAGDYQKQLACGAVLACRARHFAEAPTESSNEVIKAWSILDAEEATQLSVDMESDSAGTEGNEYENWIRRIADSVESRIH